MTTGNQVTTGQRTSVRFLARHAPILAAEDSLPRAAELMRAYNVGALAIASGGRVVGIVRDSDLAEPLSRSKTESGWLKVGDLVDGEPVVVLHGSTPLEQALTTLRNAPYPALPVMEEDGLYRGMVTAGDLLAYWVPERKPRRIGGMATPFGVFLTGGGLRGGVGDRSLILSGACLGLFAVAILFGLDTALSTIDRMVGLPVAAIVASTPTGGLMWSDLAVVAYRLVPFLLFTVAIRLSPIAGYHAAEHQTVWAIERGEALTPESVARMPRPHPRCGTNLLVGLMIFETLRDFQPHLALLCSVLFWRRLGGFIQLHLTTRPATRRQLESGIRAGEELLRKYREYPDGTANRSFLRRVWNLGLIQGIIGMTLVMTVFWNLVEEASRL